MTRKHYSKLLVILSLLLILVASIFYITICNKKPNVSYNYLKFPNTDWGMSKEECLKSLNLSEKDIDYVIKFHPSNQSEIFNVNSDVFGYPAEITYCFKNVLNDSYNDLSLYQVSIEFLGEIDIDKVKEELGNQVNLQKVDFVDNDISQFPDMLKMYFSKFNIGSLKNKKIEEKAKRVVNSKKGNRYSNNVPLSGIGLLYSKDEDYYYISYSGNYAAILNKLLS